MLKNYFTASIRSLRKHFSYSTINIVGIGLGLATCVLLTVWINHELSFDHFHNNASRIYRASLEYSFGGQTWKRYLSPLVLPKGETLLSYRSQNNDGITEDIGQRLFKGLVGGICGCSERQRAVSMRNRRSFLQVESNDRC